MWSIVRAVMRWPPSSYCMLSVVLFVKWVVWFPIMLNRYGLSDAVDAALTTPKVGHPIRNGRIGLTTIKSHMSPLWHPPTQ
jgi:hypothetical protein